MKRYAIILPAMVSILVLGFGVNTRAEAPQLINYQGILADDVGQPIQGIHDLTFAMYPDTLEQSPTLWVELHYGVTVTDGLFNVILGSTSIPIPDSLFDREELWLGVTVDADAEIYPRMRITSVPWALRAAVADSVIGGGSGSDGDWTISGNDLYLAVPGNVGLGITAPDEKLDVVGVVQTQGFKMPTGAVDGYVLTSDGSGAATWQPGGGAAGDGDWTIAGDDMYATVSGNVGIGTTTPGNRLEVVTETGRAIYARTSDGEAIYTRHYGGGGAAGLSGADYGVYGQDSDGFGVKGISDSVAVYGNNPGSGAFGCLGYDQYGAYGEGNSGDFGWLGHWTYGAYGENVYSGNFGGLGHSDYGAYGEDGFSGNFGSLGSQYYGVHGCSPNHYGVNGLSDTGTAVRGFATSGVGVHGIRSANGNTGSLGGEDWGVYGQSSIGYGVKGFSPNNVGVYGLSSTGDGVYGASEFGPAGRFNGNLVVENGRIYAPVIEITGGSDLSERFEIHACAAGLDPLAGMVVCLDPTTPGDLVVSDRAYDKRVAGVISGAGGLVPGMLMGQQGSEADGAHPVALTGRVYCWADASLGSIEPGDLLTTSETPGHAMRASDPRRCHGTVIGKAMSALPEGRGLVLVLVNLQ